MSRYANALDAEKSKSRVLLFVVFLMALMNAGLWYGWKSAPKHLLVTIPPDLRHGAIMKPGSYEAANVYAFAYQTFRELHHWPENGAQDYARKIFEQQAYLTPRYRDILIRDMNVKNDMGELEERVRWTLDHDATLTYQDEDVEPLPDGSWLCHIRLTVVEAIAGEEIKRVSIHYPLRVVKMNISPKQNIWGLALDGYPKGQFEQRIEEPGNAT